jgi:hypothetical protein
MNYIIENNIDFYNELNKELLEETNKESNKELECNDNMCLLTHQQLEDPLITLECGHKFNYLPLYHEIYNQKKDNYLEITFLKINQIKCPYCRSVTNKLLPYIKDKDVTYKRGVNCPLKYCMKLHSCEWLKYGKNKNQVICNKDAFKSEHGTYCSVHQNYCKNKHIKQELKEEHEKLNKKYNVSQLRQLLRDNKEKCKFVISGNKKEMIHRIISWGLENHTITDTTLFTTSITDTTLFNTFK